MAMASNETASAYSTRARFATTGALSALKQASFDLSASGGKSGNRFVPRSYSEVTSEGRRSTNLKISFSGGVATRVTGDTGSSAPARQSTHPARRLRPVDGALCRPARPGSEPALFLERGRLRRPPPRPSQTYQPEGPRWRPRPMLGAVPPHRRLFRQRTAPQHRSGCRSSMSRRGTPCAPTPWSCAPAMAKCRCIADKAGHDPRQASHRRRHSGASHRVAQHRPRRAASAPRGGQDHRRAPGNAGPTASPKAASSCWSLGRLAARAAAERMASTLGEKTGENSGLPCPRRCQSLRGDPDRGRHRRHPHPPHPVRPGTHRHRRRDLRRVPRTLSQRRSRACSLPRSGRCPARRPVALGHVRHTRRHPGGRADAGPHRHLRRPQLPGRNPPHRRAHT